MPNRLPLHPASESTQQLRAQRVNDNTHQNAMDSIYEAPLRRTSSSSSFSSLSEDDTPNTTTPRRQKTETIHYPKKTNSAMPPPDRLNVKNDQFKAKGKVSKHDGRLNISMKDVLNTGWLGKAVNARIKHHVTHNGKHDRQQHEHEAEEEQAAQRIASTMPARWDSGPRPKLNIVVMVIGSRGDIQPFIKIGKILKDDHGHRVRIATHPAFKDFIEKDCGLEFFSIGGNPSELMAFMVKNPGYVFFNL